MNTFESELKTNVRNAVLDKIKAQNPCSYDSLYNECVRQVVGMTGSRSARMMNSIVIDDAITSLVVAGEIEISSVWDEEESGFYVTFDLPVPMAENIVTAYEIRLENVGCTDACETHTVAAPNIEQAEREAIDFCRRHLMSANIGLRRPEVFPGTSDETEYNVTAGLGTVGKVFIKEVK